MLSRTISHDRQEETPEAKARWFQALSPAERMELLCFFTDLILTTNPQIVEQKDAQPLAGRVRVLTRNYSGIEPLRRFPEDYLFVVSNFRPKVSSSAKNRLIDKAIRNLRKGG